MSTFEMGVRTVILCAMLVVATGQAQQDEKTWSRTKFTLSDYHVAGVNLATYGMEGTRDVATDAEPFELFEDFNCLSIQDISGNETWWEMQNWFKRKAHGRSLTFYNDKISLKKWLSKLGYDIPEPFALLFDSELTSTGDVEDETKAILKLLPNNTDYVAKPSHKSRSRGVWIVSHDTTSGVARVSRDADGQLVAEPHFDPEEIAKDLAHHLHDDYDKDETPKSRIPMSKRDMERGIVIEERFTSFDFDGYPALEFKILTLWGRLHVANCRLGGYRGPWWPGVVDRNGNMLEGSEIPSLPDWVDWSRVVDIAERLGANKDVFRVDLLVGVPAGSPAMRKEATESERKNAVRYVVSEVSHISAEPFPDEITEESLRLWIAGYKIGNYRLIPNREVPPEFQDRREQHREL